MKPMKWASAFLAFIVALCLSVPAAAVGISDTSSGSSVVITADAATFSATVPTSIPVNIDKYANVICPDGLRIYNDSAASIEIAAIEIQDGQWTVADFNAGNRSKLAQAKVDSNQLGLAFTPWGGSQTGTYTSGTQLLNIDPREWVVASQSSLDFTCDGIATAISEAISAPVEAVKVIFTVGWEDGLTPTGYTVQSLNAVMSDGEAVNLKLGESVQMGAVAVYSDDTPVWTSLDASIVSVSQSGLARAVGVGVTTVIYAYGDLLASVPFIITCDHLNTEVRNVASATYMSEGYTGDVYCTDCDALLRVGTVIDALVCPHEHTYVDGYEAATCESVGYTGDTYCLDCGKLLEVGHAVSALDHDWGEPEVLIAPTFDEEGTVRYTCQRCGEVTTVSIPATGGTDDDPPASDLGESE